MYDKASDKLVVGTTANQASHAQPCQLPCSDGEAACVHIDRRMPKQSRLQLCTGSTSDEYIGHRNDNGL
jgi:hypothetical protein